MDYIHKNGITFDYCRGCKRTEYCQYPCDDYSKELDRFNKLNDNVINEKQSMSEENGENERSNPHKIQILKGMDCDRECLEDYMTVSVEDDTWLEVLNGRYTIEQVIDYDDIHRYMTERNREYCEKQGLCEECRSELVEVNDPKGEFWGTPVSEKILICPKCG
jgi:hypothetical protein